MGGRCPISPGAGESGIASKLEAHRIGRAGCRFSRGVVERRREKCREVINSRARSENNIANPNALTTWKMLTFNSEKNYRRDPKSDLI